MNLKNEKKKTIFVYNFSCEHPIVNNVNVLFSNNHGIILIISTYIKKS